MEENSSCDGVAVLPLIFFQRFGSGRLVRFPTCRYRMPLEVWGFRMMRKDPDLYPTRQAPTWRIIPLSKWLVTPIYEPFKPFVRGTTLLGGLTITMVINHFLNGMILQVPVIHGVNPTCRGPMSLHLAPAFPGPALSQYVFLVIRIHITLRVTYQGRGLQGGPLSMATNGGTCGNRGYFTQVELWAPAPTGSTGDFWGPERL